MARSPNTDRNGGLFDDVTIEAVWQKATSEVARFRKDRCGASMLRCKYGQTERWGWGKLLGPLGAASQSASSAATPNRIGGVFFD